MQLFKDSIKYVQGIELSIPSETNGSFLVGNPAGYVLLGEILTRKNLPRFSNRQKALDVFLKSINSNGC